MQKRITRASSTAAQAAIHLRPMSAADLVTVLSLERQCHPRSWPACFFRRLLRSRASCWVFEKDGVVVGYGIMRCLRDKAHIMNLCISPAYRQHGLGRKMLIHLMTVAQNRGAKQAWLEVFPTNRLAIALYRRLGFRSSYRRKGYYRYAPQRQRDALAMAISLDR